MGSLARPDQRSVGVVDPNAAATDLRAVQDDMVGSERHRIRRYPCGATAGRPRANGGEKMAAAAKRNRSAFQRR